MQSVTDPEVSKVDYADLLVSYGSQLLKTGLTTTNPEQATRVVRECVNVRCDVFQHGNDFSLVNLLRHRVNHSQHLEPWIPDHNVMRNCTELVAVVVFNIEAFSQDTAEISDDLIGAVLPMKMPLL